MALFDRPRLIPNRRSIIIAITLFFLISTPFFSPSLDVLIFWAFSASNVLKGVLTLISYKFLESYLLKAVEMISDRLFNSSKRN